MILKGQLRGVLASLAISVVGVAAQTWCGKNYQASTPPGDPGGKFTIPATSETPLLALRCAQAFSPYLDADGHLPGFSADIAIVIDTPVTYSQVSNAAPISIPNLDALGSVNIVVSANGVRIAGGDVPLNITKYLMPFSLSPIKSQVEAYNLSCTATYNGQTFSASGLLSYLPDPPAGMSVTKFNTRTGGLMVKSTAGKNAYENIFPIGFYTSFGGYLDKDFTIPAQLKAQGFNVIHPIPPFENLTALDIVLDKMKEADMYLMYDMRWDYMNSTSVTEQVDRIKSYPNLLLWYTGDEPDGWGDPLEATVKSSNLIKSLDGGDGKGGAGYHPVSLVLNCQDYYFSEYASGGDIVMQDAYTIGINATYSTVWGTVCTDSYGDCGCDNCKGSFEDISTRIDQFKSRLFANGWEQTKGIWTVPQAFGNDSYWSRIPTGQEFIVQTILGINHGATGSISWDDPTTADIKASASKLALALPKMTPFILNTYATFRQVTINRVDIGLWKVGSDLLVLATNMNYSPVSIKISDLDLPGLLQSITQVLDSGAQARSTEEFSFASTGSGAFVLKLLQ